MRKAKAAVSSDDEVLTSDEGDWLTSDGGSNSSDGESSDEPEWVPDEYRVRC